MNDRDPLQAAVTALAGEVERLTRQLAEVKTDAAQAGQTAEAAHRALIDIVDRVADLANQHTGQVAEQTDQPTGPTSWLTITDPDQRQTVMADLVDWMQRVYIHYPDSPASLGECWQLHPAAVEELLALKAAWHAAYAAGTPAYRAIDWHDRHLPGTQHRLHTMLADCSQAAHQPGGRAHHPDLTVPTATLDAAAARITTGEPVSCSR